MTEDDYTEQGDLNRIPIGATLYQQYLAVQDEYSRGMRISGNFSTFEYTEMRTLLSMVEAQGTAYPDIMEKYLKEWDSFNQRYGNPEYRIWAFSVLEASERKKLLEKMLVDLGITRLDSRPQPPQIQRYDYGYRYDGREIIYRTWKKRESENRNLNVIMTGKVGGGKSLGSLSTGNYLNHNYDLDNICYEISQFIDRIQSQPKGSVIILDEAGVAAGNKDSMTTAAKSLSKTIQSTRYLQMISIFNIPNIAFLDRQVKTLCDLVFTHEQDMRQGEFSVAIPELTEDGKDIEFLPLRFDGRLIQTVYFPLPPPQLIEGYETRRKQHNMAQLTELKEKLSPAKKEKEPEEDRRGKNPNSIKNLRPFRRDDNGE